MEVLRRGRRPHRREFDNLYRDLEQLFRADPIDVDQINIKYGVFSFTCAKLFEQDNQVMEQFLLEEVNEVNENKEYDEIQQYRMRAETIRMLMGKLQTPPPVTTESCAGTNGNGEAKIRNFKLPTVEMKKFSGELRDWLGFWAQFQKIDEDPHMHGSDKFWYLLQSLEPGTDAHEIASGYPQSNENYSKVIDALKKQYGNEDMLLQVYIRELLRLVISNVNTKDKIPMKTLYLKLDSHLRALKTLNLEKADPATWLFPLVESSLPENILYNWQRSPLSTHDGKADNPPRTRLELLMSFVEKEVEIRQRIEITRSFTNDQQAGKGGGKILAKEIKPDKRSHVPTLSTFHVGDVRKCAFCGKTNHVSAKCYRARMMSHDEKMKLLKEKRLCYRCAGNHLGRNCDSKGVECGICHRGHFTVLCRDFKGEDDNRGPLPKRQKMEQEKTQTTTSSSNLECSGDVALQTLYVRIANGPRQEVVRAFIDSGSQRSYLHYSTARKLNLVPIGIERVVHSLFGGQQTKAVSHNKYELNVESLEDKFSLKIEVREHQQLCGKIPRIPHLYPNLTSDLRTHGVTLREERQWSNEIQLLIGADWYAHILTGKVIKFNGGPLAIHTRLGWTIMGQVADYSSKDSIANLCLSMAVSDENITQLWDLETLGIKCSTELIPKNDRENEIKLKFQQNITRTEDGRYVIKLPWKEELDLLPSNRAVAFKRLQSATTKLVQRELFEAYDSIFKDWKKEGFIEEVPPRENEIKCHYLPHRPVVKAESLTTPVRPVFDASCRVGKLPSLNDCLLKGDNFVQIIPDLILRFREKRVAFVSDIRKAFQMVGVHHEDRDYMRFLWWKNREMKETIEYRHARVMFGATCSPFILGSVLNYHLNNLAKKDQVVGKKLESTFYVDNCVSSENSYSEYQHFKDKATELMRGAAMDLRMWFSNVDELENNETQVISVLGLLWDRKTDELFVNTKKIQVPEKITKRVVLSTIQKLFDPMGFICPSVLPMKILLQKVWINRLKWDEELPKDEGSLFVKWCRDVTNLELIRIPRLSTAGVVRRDMWSLHIFTDASRDAFSCAVFLRVRKPACVEVQLLTAKSRVAPVKQAKGKKATVTQLTINQLELMGCLIGARLAATVKAALKLEDINETYWCDSTTALAWIRRNDQWLTFVANRAKEINSLTKAENWRHVPGTVNPADLPSRGCSPSELLRSRWWEGPSWLYCEEHLWPISTEKANESEVLAARRKTEVLEPTMSFSIFDNVTKQCSFFKLVRIIGWVRRFLFNYLVLRKEKRKYGPLKQDELHRAEIILIRDIQGEEFRNKQDNLKGLEVFKDDWGVIRVKTRLTYRTLPDYFKFPMLLPNKRAEVQQLIMDTHRCYCHGGAGFLTVKLRSRYWILKARKTIKNVISKCLRCRRYTAKPTIPEAAPLPLNRIKDSEVFEVVGIDLAGPLILKNNSKVWIVIFTCAVYRAVHFELVNSLSTRVFITALAKFIKIYRRPAIIYSDNGTNFRGAANLFKSLDWTLIMKNDPTAEIEWKFNPATAAWWGGWWERLIRTVKDLLKRTVGKASLKFNELEAVLATVKEVMNNRPLTYVSEDQADLEPLTPSLFLHPFGNVVFPEAELTEAQRMRFRYEYVTNLKKELKNRFLKEYLALLVNRNPKKSTGGLKVGDLVLIGSDNLKRIEWPLAKIIELIPGNDGVCRVVKVKTAKGEITRAVQRVYPLEMDPTDPYEKTVKEKATVTRFGRTVNPPNKFK